MSSENLGDLGKVWVSWGGVWGGEFDDPIHFEFPGFPHALVKKANIVQKAAEKYGALPWWTTVALPVTAGVEPDHSDQIVAKINAWFGTNF